MRSRDIRPGFYLNAELAECSCFARLIFPGMWMMADREGRLEDSPKRIKAELLPYDNKNIVKLLEDLEAHGLIVRYAVDGEELIWIPTFTLNQRPHPNEQASLLPSCPASALSKSLLRRLQRAGEEGKKILESLDPHSTQDKDEVIQHVEQSDNRVLPDVNQDNTNVNMDVNQGDNRVLPRCASSSFTSLSS